MAEPVPDDTTAGAAFPKVPAYRRALRIAGPGIITGGADNDPAGIATYSQVGATTGFSQLWLLLLSVPLLIAVQGIAARLANVTKLGLAELIRNEFGRPIALLAGLITVVANVATIGADLVAMAAVLELLTHVHLIFFIVPLVVVMGYLTIFQDFKVIEKFLLWLVVVYLTYVVAGFLSHPDWGVILKDTVIPPIQPNVTYFAGAVGLLGTTITPYLFFWQAAGEREERRGVEELKDTYLDVSSGMVISNVIAYFIVISTASTLYVHNRSINTAADAAKALEPFAGHFASILFSIGILGAGLMAIPILAASTGYVVAGTFGWRMGLGRQAFSAPGFYSVIALSLLAGVELAISGFSPIKALFYSQILNGLVAPVLIALMVILVGRRSLMGQYAATRWELIGGWVAVAVMTLADVALIYSLV
ncbi:MAG: divalent metal cation transporter [Chloroflexi bacterium]|nr:divalent metal cation transporter [Chloroflexota bacterium]